MERNSGDRMSLIASQPLTNRLCVFFLAMIALVLVAFSTAFYGFASIFLHRQLEEKVTSSLQALAAAVETSPQGVEWEPHSRPLSVGVSPPTGDAVWVVLDQDARLIDESANLDLSEVAAAITVKQPRSAVDQLPRRWHDDNWLVAEEWIRNNPSLANSSEASIGLDDDEVFHDAICLRVAVSMSPVQAVMRTMATTLIVLSVTVWTGSLLASRSVCSRALQPLREMTNTAQNMSGENLTARLPNIQTQDEMADLTRAFNALLDRVQDSFLRQQRFTGDASHQMRTPLTAILGQIEVTLRRERSPDEYSRALEVVHGRATHLKHIVESLLFLARADADSELPNRQAVDVKYLVSEWVSAFAEHERASDLKFECRLRESVMVFGHTILLNELWTILIDNAFKFSQQGTEVRIQLEADADAAVLSIRDQGHGISAADLPLVGTPFFRAEAAKQRGIHGIGLGLSIAFRLAQTLNVTLDVSSENENGTTVFVRMPLLSADCPMG